MKIRAPQSGVVLDDLFATIREMRSVFKLRRATFGLKEIEEQPGASLAVANLIDAAVKFRAGGIFSKRDEFLSKAGEGIYGELIQNSVYSGYKLSPEGANHALRIALEITLQTIIQLPTQDPKSAYYNPKRVRSVSLRLSKLADEMKTILQPRDLHERAKLLNLDAGRLSHVIDELRWASEALNTISRSSGIIKKVKSDSPNPQVRLALYLAEFFNASTGGKQYRVLQALANAAFVTAGTETPKWVDRLAIEMNQKRARRRAWVSTIFVKEPR